MAGTNYKQFQRKTISKTAYAANIIYLIVHIFYLILFIVAKLNIMIYITLGVIAIYLLFFLVIKKKKFYLYALLCGNEFFAFIIASTLLVGFGSGFHFYLIGLCVVSFFTSYFSKHRSTRNSLIWVGLSLAIYLTLYFVSRNNPPYYQIEPWLEMTLFTTHAIGVFAFIASYLVVILKYAVTLEQQIMSESRTDELTQVNNRYGLYDYYDQLEVTDSHVIALFDIDDFKGINDTHGHVAGDFILKRVAEITSSVLKDQKDHFFCRYGGEEFVFVLNEGDNNKVLELLEKVRKSIETELFAFEYFNIHITITIGAYRHEEGLTLEKWLELADQRMYRGKNNGKNQVVFQS